MLAGLGFGNFAAVLLGHEPYRRRLVAIKRFLIPRSGVSQVIDEINGMDVLRGKPKIVQFYGYEVEELDTDGKTSLDPAGSDNLRFYIIMEYGGETLEKYLGTCGLKAAENDAPEAGISDRIRAFLFTRDILTGLNGSHREHIIHRDIKPLNIYISPSGQARIGDFGVAKKVISEGLHSGTVVGTAQYMAPEQVSEGVYSANVDLFATGVTLYRMLTGRMPFRTVGELLSHQPELTLPGITPLVFGILHRSLEKDPQARYQTSSEMLHDVEKWGEELRQACPCDFDSERNKIGEQVRELLGGDVLDLIQKAEVGEDLKPLPGPQADSAAAEPRQHSEADSSEKVSREAGPVATPHERIAHRTVHPILLLLEGTCQDRKTRRVLRASDRSLEDGDVAGAITRLENICGLDDEDRNVVTRHLDDLRNLLEWEGTAGEESKRLLAEKRYREAEHALNPLVSKYLHSRLAGRLRKIRKYREVTSKILGEARRYHSYKRYGKAIGLYRKVLKREPYQQHVIENLEKVLELRRKVLKRRLARSAVYAALTAVAVISVFIFRAQIARQVVEGGRALQEKGWYTSPVILNSNAVYNLAGLLHGKSTEAAAAKAQLKQLLVDNLARAERSGDTDAARDFCQQALIVDPDDPELLRKADELRQTR